MIADPDRESQFRQMRDTARELFRHALAQASIAQAFARHVHCERGVLRICEDLYDLQSYSRVLAISIGKAGHTMVEALTHQLGESALEGIVASSVAQSTQVRGFRYFRGGHPTPNADSIHAANAIRKVLDAQTAASLVIFMISGGGSSIVEKPIDVGALVALKSLLESLVLYIDWCDLFHRFVSYGLLPMKSKVPSAIIESRKPAALTTMPAGTTR